MEGTPREALMALFADNGLPKDGRFFGISVREWQTNDPDFVRKIAEIADYADNVAAVTLQDVRRAAKNLFERQAMVIGKAQPPEGDRNE